VSNRKGTFLVRTGIKFIRQRQQKSFPVVLSMHDRETRRKLRNASVARRRIQHAVNVRCAYGKLQLIGGLNVDCRGAFPF
jgi:hypothetical protein